VTVLPGKNAMPLRRTRTLNPLIKSQQAQFVNNSREKSYGHECFEVTPNATTFQNANIDDDLRHIIQTWSTLPPTLKARIVGMIEAAVILSVTR